MKNSLIRNWLLVGLGALIIPAMSSAQDSEPTVLVRRVVPANFHDINFDQGKFNDLLTNSTNRAVLVKPDSTVSDLLKEQYNMSRSWTPAVYERLKAHVLALNKVHDPTKDLKGGQILMLPDLPRTAQINLKRGKADPSQTKSSMAIKWDLKSQAFAGSPKVSSTSAGTAATELQIRVFPVSALLGLKLPSNTTPLDALIDNHEYQVMQEEMTVTFAGAPVDTDSVALLSTPEKNSLRNFLARPAITKPLVVILDDSYPTQNDFFSAVKFVISASREIRQKFGLEDAAHGDSAALLMVEKNYRQGTLFCDDCEYPKLKLHSAMIRKSLEELREADTNQRVEVIYLPINAAQPFSKELFAEILNVSLLADSVANGLVLMAPGIQPPEGLRRGTPVFSSIAPQIEKLLAPKGLYDPLSAYSGGTMTAKTDRGIIDGIVNFLWLYSMASQRPHFLSMSWTSPNLKYPVLFRPNGYGLWLAAAGNDPQINVHAALRQFAARSSDPGDVLAVENLQSACETSTITSDDVPVFGFAFPGRISSSFCGTSFSTPRIAWFLAAYEAIKGKPIKPYSYAWNLWRASKRTKLMALQTSQQTGEDRYRVSPWQLLEEPTPH